MTNSRSNNTRGKTVQLGVALLAMFALAQMAHAQGAPLNIMIRPVPAAPVNPPAGPQLNRAIMKDIDGRTYTQWPKEDCVLRFRPWIIPQSHRTTCYVENLYVHDVINMKAIHVGLTSFDKPLVNGEIPTYSNLIVRNVEIAGTNRNAAGATAGIHTDCLMINGGTRVNSFLPNVLIQDVYIHDSNAMTILFNECQINQIILRRVYAERVNTPIVIYPTGQYMVNEVVIEDSPGIKVALQGGMGRIGRCIVRRCPGASISNVRMGDGTQTKTPIIYQP